MTEPERPDSRSLRSSLIFIGVLVAFVAGYLVAGLIDSEPSDPALAFAQEVALALPAEQEAAFFDGEISSEEREEAADRFRQCVEDAGVTDFVLELSDDGHSISVGSFSRAVQVCEVRHFVATNSVYLHQIRTGTG